MGSAIYAVDHGIGGAMEFIIETAGDKTPNDRLRGVRLFERVVADAALNPLLGEPLVDPSDDVVAFAERPQRRFGPFGQVPPRCAHRLCEAEALELAHAADQGRSGLSVRPAIRSWSQIDNTIMA
jgi:hypothetical protein